MPNRGHWESEDFKQRMTRKEWQKLLLDGDDTIIFHGTVRHLTAKHIGAGVYEVSKTPRTNIAHDPIN